MANDDILGRFKSGAIDQQALFDELFSESAMTEVFIASFRASAAKGTDRLNGFQFAMNAVGEFIPASIRLRSGRYLFAPYLEVLKTKGRDKNPRVIGIPTIRDRVVLNQLNSYLSAIYPERVPKNVAGTYVREISGALRDADLDQTWVCSTDIRTFYDSIDRKRLIKALSQRIVVKAALRLIEHSIQTPTVPQNTHRERRKEYQTGVGVPQGLAISNILASIYMTEVDEAMRSRPAISYYRYVDDVLIFGTCADVNGAFRSLAARLRPRGLRLHKPSSGKTQIEPLRKPFGYLGYHFNGHLITVREITVERFLQSIAGRFSDFVHNTGRRLDRYKYLTEERMAEIFLAELNERITGAISSKKRYGWIAYFSQITDQTLLHRVDSAISGLFRRLPAFDRAPPAGLKRLARAHWEMRFNPGGGYVRDYDKIVTRAQKIDFLVFRGRIGPEETLTDEQINSRYENYVRHVLSAMHADEGAVY